MEILDIIRNVLKRKKIVSEIEEDFTGRPDKGKSFNIGLAKELLPFIKLKWKRGAFASILLIFATLLSLPQPLLTKYLIDDVLLKNDYNLLGIIIGILVALLVLHVLLSFLRGYHFFRFEQEIILEIQKQLFNRVLRFPKSFFDSKETGYMMARVTGDVSMLRMFFSSTIVEIGTNILRFAGGITILLFLHWKLALISLLVLPLFFIISMKMGKITKRLSFHMMEKGAQVSKHLQSSLSGIDLIKSFSAEERETQKITNSMKESMDVSIEQRTIGSIGQLLIGLISSLAGIFVLWYGAREVFAQRLTIGSLIAFNSYLAYLYGPTRFLASIHIQFQTAWAALHRVFTIFHLIPEDEDDDDKKKVSKLKGEVTFSNVSFGYVPGAPVLNDITFSVKAGENFAIVGPTGVGKSTLANLVMRLYRPESGKILFDGMDAETMQIRPLRERIAIVSQEIFLFNESILDNIRYGRMEATDEEVIEAAKLSFVHEFINSLPGGYQTKVGERGVRLSVGQKQRISIARALLRDANILIFDEPTSALDALTETAIKEAIYEKSNGKTTFIIAHRLSTVLYADSIIVLSGGKIVQQGNHKELLGQKGLYREMWKEQGMVSAEVKR